MVRRPADPVIITKGGAELVATLRSTEPHLSMWAWGADQHVRFWSRRQLHETLIHRVDLELAMGAQPFIDQNIAADGIDEFLANLPSAASFSPDIGQLIGQERRLAFAEPDGGRRWCVTLARDGIFVSADTEETDVELVATCEDLLLTLYGRVSLEEVDAVVSGDQGLLNFWLTHSSLL